MLSSSFSKIILKEQILKTQLPNTSLVFLAACGIGEAPIGSPSPLFSGRLANQKYHSDSHFQFHNLTTVVFGEKKKEIKQKQIGKAYYNSNILSLKTIEDSNMPNKETLYWRSTS